MAVHPDKVVTGRPRSHSFGDEPVFGRELAHHILNKERPGVELR